MSGEAADTGSTPQIGDETVELELTAAEQLELARAAELAIGPPPAAAPNAGHDTYLYGRTRRIDVIGTITFAVLVSAVTAFLGWRALLKPEAEPVAADTVSPVIIAPLPRAQELPAVVQVVNPFDATEVFELPPQTTEAEARDAVARLLLQRAQDRLQQGIELGHARHRLPPVVAANPRDIIVTRISAVSGGPEESLSLRAAPGIGE